MSSFTSSLCTSERATEYQLKELLKMILDYLERFVDNTQDIVSVQGKLHDYEDLPELIKIIQKVFMKLMDKVQAKCKCISKKKERPGDYQLLEQLIQKHEAEIRQHISREQQMSLMFDSLQQQLEESEYTRKEFTTQTAKIIRGLKRENTQLNNQLKKVTTENENLLKQIDTITQTQKEQEHKYDKIPQMLMQLENLINILKINGLDVAEKVRDNNRGGKNMSLVNLGSSASKINQSTDYPSQVSTKFCMLTNSGSTPLRFQKGISQKNKLQRAMELNQDDYQRLQRSRGVSMHIKQEAIKEIEQIRNKSYSVGVSKNCSQENCTINDILQKSHNSGKYKQYLPVFQMLKKNSTQFYNRRNSEQPPLIKYLEDRIKKT